MHPKKLGLLMALTGGFLSAGASLCAAPISPYGLIGEIPIGGDGGWDYVSVDSAARRLYVSHSSRIVVVDMDADKVVGEIADTPGVHGLAVAPELKRGFSSNGREATASIVDLTTLKTTAKVSTGAGPDAILFEPAHQEVYTFNGRENSATVFDALSGKVVATIPLPGRPEFAVAVPQAGRVYCNIEDKSEVVAIDSKTHQIVNTWPIAPGESASGMAIDVAHHRLFLGCDNQFMVVMDSETGKVVATVPIGRGVDANAFDPATGLAFSSNGEGNVTIVHETTPDEFSVAQTLATARGARTMALDPKTHRIYLPSAQYEAAPTETPSADGHRKWPKMIPGTFKVLVYGPKAAAAG